jgi:hypothetical protein
MRKVGCLTPLDTECYISTYTDPVNKNLMNFLSKHEDIKHDPNWSDILGSTDTNSPAKTATSPTQLKSYTTKSLDLRVKSADSLKITNQGKASIIQLLKKNVLYYTTPLMLGTSRLTSIFDDDNAELIHKYRKVRKTNCHVLFSSI